MKLAAVRVFVRDLAGAQSFYSGKLGLSLTAGSAKRGYCVFAAGGADLVVEPVARDAPQDEQVLVGRFTGLSFAVNDAMAKYEELSALGVEFSGVPELQTWGGTLATFRDPANNELQIVQY